jgi:hypothetical protein
MAVIRKYIRKYIRIESQRSTAKISHNGRDGLNGSILWIWNCQSKLSLPVQTCKHDVIKYININCFSPPPPPQRFKPPKPYGVWGVSLSWSSEQLQNSVAAKSQEITYYLQSNFSWERNAIFVSSPMFKLQCKIKDVYFQTSNLASDF